MKILFLTITNALIIFLIICIWSFLFPEAHHTLQNINILDLLSILLLFKITMEIPLKVYNWVFEKQKSCK